MGDCLVELLIIGLFQFRFGLFPERGRGVDLICFLFFLGFFALLLVFFAHIVGMDIVEKDWKGDVIRVLLDHLVDLPTVGVLLARLAEMHDHIRAKAVSFCFSDFECALAVACPLIRLVLAGLAADDIHPVCHHEGGIETHAKLANEIRVPIRIAGQVGQEVLGAGTGNGAEILSQFFFIHANAGVADGECLLVLVIKADLDLRIKRKGLELIFGECQVLQLVECVRGV